MRAVRVALPVLLLLSVAGMACSSPAQQPPGRAAHARAYGSANQHRRPASDGNGSAAERGFSPTNGWRAPGTPAEPAAPNMEFVSVQGGRPGGRASVTVHTTPGAQCSMNYVTPLGSSSNA